MTRILADQGKKAGITISDDVINHFLKETSFRRVSDQEILAFCKVFVEGIPAVWKKCSSPASASCCWATLTCQVLLPTIQNVLPEQRWEDWKRINERISLEVDHNSSARFCERCPGSKRSRILAFYEQYKNAEPHVPHSSWEPSCLRQIQGFKFRAKCGLAYFSAT